MSDDLDTSAFEKWWKENKESFRTPNRSKSEIEYAFMAGRNDFRSETVAQLKADLCKLQEKAR